MEGSTLDTFDWAAIAASLDACGAATLPSLLDAQACDEVAGLYGPHGPFRSHVVMARHGFGQGEYRYLTIRPGAYPWQNHPNAWRPAHIHLSLFGPSFVTRLVTQMFFPDDPLIPFDPILESVPTKDGRRRLISAYDHNVIEPEFALGYHFDIVLRGRKATPFEEPR